MAHAHTHGRSPATGNIRTAFFLNFCFAAVELLGGLYTNSVAILSDALHDFGDSVSLGLAWYLQKIASRGRDSRYSYGYKRFSLLGALTISLILLIGSVIVIKESVGRLFRPEEPNAEGMLVLAVLGVLINGLAFVRLRKGSSLNERAVALHFIEDILGWLAVLAASVVMMFVRVPVLDPLLSIGISIWVLVNVYRNLRDTLRVFLQQAPANVDQDEWRKKLLALPDLRSVHDVHLWSLDGEENVATLHAVVSDRTPPDRWQALKCEIKRICAEAGIRHTTVEMESEKERCACDDDDACVAPAGTDRVVRTGENV